MLDILFECLLKLDAHVDDPVELTVPLIVVIQIYRLFNEDAACLLIWQFAPIQSKSEFRFNFILMLEELMEYRLIVTDVQFRGTLTIQGSMSSSDPHPVCAF